MCPESERVGENLHVVCGRFSLPGLLLLGIHIGVRFTTIAVSRPPNMFSEILRQGVPPTSRLSSPLASVPKPTWTPSIPAPHVTSVKLRKYIVPP